MSFAHRLRGVERSMMNHVANGCCPDPSAGFVAVESIEGMSGSFFEILWRRRGTVLVAILCVLAGAGLYLQLATPLYTSTSRICVEQAGPQVLEKDSSGVITRWDSYLYTQAEWLQSTEILSAAMRAPGIADLQTFAGVDHPMDAIRGKLDVVVGRKDEIINVSFMSPYPDEAAHIVNTIVDAYIKDRARRERDTVGEVTGILKEERAQRGQELLSKLEKMVEFTQQNEHLSFRLDRYVNIILQRVEWLSAAVTEAQLAALESKSLYEATKKLANEPAGLRQLIESQRIRGSYVATANEASSLRAELNRMERDRMDLLRELEPNHWAVAALNAEMEQIRGQIDDLEKEFAQGQLAAAEQQYLIAREKEEELQKDLHEQCQQAILASHQFTQYALLESDYEQAKKLYNLLDDNVQRLDVKKEAGGLHITILERAVPALVPSAPHKAKTLALALCIGLLTGTGLALVRECKDQRLHSTREASLLLNLPVLGTIPAMDQAKSAPVACGRRIRTHPDSHEAEAFRTLCTAVFFGLPRGEARMVLVTSPAGQEGKSTVASNLGVAMAQAGQRVLIIDADLRRPVQHEIFDLDRDTEGLSAVLAGQMNIENAIERTDVENLEVLTCGPNVPNPSEVLHRTSHSQILEKLLSTYDRILIDSPPVAAAADALILAALCDVTILVLRAGVSTRKITLHCQEALAGVNARIVGIVVNSVSHGKGHCGYYSSPGYHCRYGHNGQQVPKSLPSGRFFRADSIVADERNTHSPNG